MTKHARHSRQLRGNVVQFDFQLSNFSVTQVLAAQATEVMFKKEVELPRQFCFVEGEAAGDRMCFKRMLSRLLNPGDQRDRLLLVFVTFVVRLFLVDVKELSI